MTFLCLHNGPRHIVELLVPALGLEERMEMPCQGPPPQQTCLRLLMDPMQDFLEVDEDAISTLCILGTGLGSS